MKRQLLLLLLGVASVLNVRVAQSAEPEPVHVAQAAEPEHDLSLTIAPSFDLSLQLGCELKLIPRVSVGLLLGVGSTWSAGVQGRYYVLGNFDHGMPVALEVLGVDFPDAAIMLSGLLGYKKVFGFGLTLDFNAGVGIVTSNRGGGASYYPATMRLNLGVGWSF